MLYLIRNDDKLKIGYTDDLERRLKQYNTHNPDYELIATRKGTAEFETFLHHRFKQYRIKGEWFIYNEDIIKDFYEYKDDTFNFPKAIPEEHIKIPMDTYIEFISSMRSGRAINILGDLFRLCKYNTNEVINLDRDKLAKLYNMQKSSIGNYISILKKSGALKTDRNIIYLNPNLGFRGDVKAWKYYLNKWNKE